MEQIHYVVDSEEYALNEQLLDPTRDSHEDEEITRAAGIHLASIAEKKRLWLRNAILNALFIASWSVDNLQEIIFALHIDILLYRFFFATLLSVYNKWMFSDTHFGFPAPLFVTTIHMVVQFGLAAMLRAFWPEKFRPRETPTPRDYVCVSRAYVHVPNLVLCK